MTAMTTLRRLYYRCTARLAWRRLHSLKYEQVMRQADRAALRAFHRAAKRVPAYRNFLAEGGVDPARVTDIEAFRRLVPLTDKSSVFTANGLPSLCVDGRVDDIVCVYTSSGYSGEFSFGVETVSDMRRGLHSISPQPSAARQRSDASAGRQCEFLG